MSEPFLTSFLGCIDLRSGGKLIGYAGLTYSFLMVGLALIYFIEQMKGDKDEGAFNYSCIPVIHEVHTTCGCFQIFITIVIVANCMFSLK